MERKRNREPLIFGKTSNSIVGDGSPVPHSKRFVPALIILITHPFIFKIETREAKRFPYRVAGR